MANIRDIRFLAFGGGGSAGHAYAGAIRELAKQPEFSFKNLEGVVGTSVGALLATLISLRCTPEEISKKMQSVDFNQLFNSRGPISQTYHLFDTYGMYDNSLLRRLILETITEKTGRKDPENVTFEDLHRLGCIDLHIITTKIYKVHKVAPDGKKKKTETGKEKTFSYAKTPLTPIADVILASTAAPFYFSRVRLKKMAPGKYVAHQEGHAYADGGITNNFAIEYFDKFRYLKESDKDNDGGTIMNPHTLGLALFESEDIVDNGAKITKTPLKDKHLIKYSKGVINTMMTQSSKHKYERKKNATRTVMIDRLDVKLDDTVDENKIKDLIISGGNAVKKYFEKMRLLDKEKEKYDNETRLVKDKKAVNSPFFIPPNKSDNPNEIVQEMIEVGESPKTYLRK